MIVRCGSCKSVISRFTVGIRLVVCVPRSNVSFTLLPTAAMRSKTALKFQEQLSRTWPKFTRGVPGQPLVVPASLYIYIYTYIYIHIYIILSIEYNITYMQHILYAYNSAHDCKSSTMLLSLEKLTSVKILHKYPQVCLNQGRAIRCTSSNELGWSNFLHASKI